MTNRPPICFTRPVASWTVDDVGQWLSFLGLSRLVCDFSENRIDGSSLIGMYVDPVAMDRLVIEQSDRVLLIRMISAAVVFQVDDSQICDTPCISLKVVESKGGARFVNVSRSGATGGRSSKSDIVVSDVSASRDHFEISFEYGSGFVLKDNKSTFGTYLKIQDRKVVMGDVYLLGSREVYVSYVDKEVLDIEVRGKQPSIRRRITGNCGLGRDASSEIVIADSQVSHNHAEFFKSGSHFFIRDTSSTNGVWAKVKRAVLYTDEVFKVGSTTFTVQSISLQPSMSTASSPSPLDDPVLSNRTVAIESNEKDDDMCKLCFGSVIQTVVVPCGHMVACVTCGSLLKDCPICRKPFTSVIRTYRA